MKVKGISVLPLTSNENYFVLLPREIEKNEELGIKDNDYVMLSNDIEPKLFWLAQIKYHDQKVARFPSELIGLLVSKKQREEDKDRIFIHKSSDEKKLIWTEVLKKMENIFEFETPERFSVLPEENIILKNGVALKRLEKYQEADEVYLSILKEYGASGTLYAAWAKNKACQGSYDEAIHLFNLANESALNQYGIEDSNSINHAQTIFQRKLMPEGEFLKYMRLISGNQEYLLKKL